jgi:hypothetical protein
MPLYDHRVFDWRGEWWAAQVHGGTGAGMGARPAITHESVIFTCLSDRDKPSRSTSIPAGWLLKLGHEAIGRVLDSADVWKDRFDMAPYNAPDADEFPERYKFQDENGLSWGARRLQTPIVNKDGPVLRHSVELVCLDDSALRGEIPFATGETLDDFLSIHGTAGLAALAALLTSRMDNAYDPTEDLH